MSDTVLYKTIIQVEVLSDVPFEWDTLKSVDYAINEGGCSGLVEEIGTERLNRAQAIKECEKHDTDPGFFLIKEDDS